MIDFVVYVVLATIFGRGLRWLVIYALRPQPPANESGEDEGRDFAGSIPGNWRRL